VICAKTILFIICLSVLTANAHEGEETEAQIGPGKAVEAYDAIHGLKLSEKAKKSIGISTLKMTKQFLQQIPSSALVKTRGEHAVYTVSNGNFKFIPVEKLVVGDEVVVEGTALLRVAEINVSSSADEEHEIEEHSEHEAETQGKAKDLDHD